MKHYHLWQKATNYTKFKARWVMWSCQHSPIYVEQCGIISIPTLLAIMHQYRNAYILYLLKPAAWLLVRSLHYITARSHFYGTLIGSPRVYMPYTSSPKGTWRERALGHAQWWNNKTGQSDTRGVTVHHVYNSLQHSKGMLTWHHS